MAYFNFWGLTKKVVERILGRNDRSNLIEW